MQNVTPMVVQGIVNSDMRCFRSLYDAYKIKSLRDKYDDVYLLRNEKDVKIYGFASGQAFETDSVCL